MPPSENRWAEDTKEYKRIQKVAFEHGATEFGLSNRKHKKYYVLYNRKKIHYGSRLYQDYTIHKDEQRRINYKKRHRGITLRTGEPAYLNKNQPAYWSYWTIW